MSAAGWWAAVGGYDDTAVDLLWNPRQRLQMAVLGAATLVTSAVQALGWGLLASWATGSALATWLVGSAVFLFMVNVLRMLNAGSGVHPAEPTRPWRPALATAVVPVLWAVLAAQPLCAASRHREVEQVVAQRRLEVRALEAGRAAVTVAPRPETELALHLAAAWQSPWQAGMWTVFWTLLGALQPLLRLGWRAAGRAYAERHGELVAARVLEEDRRGQREIEEILSRYGSAGLPDWRAAYADPPFCRRLGRPGGG